VKACRLAWGKTTYFQAHYNADLAKWQLLAWQMKKDHAAAPSS